MNKEQTKNYFKALEGMKLPNRQDPVLALVLELLSAFQQLQITKHFNEDKTDEQRAVRNDVIEGLSQLMKDYKQLLTPAPLNQRDALIPGELIRVVYNYYASKTGFSYKTAANFAEYLLKLDAGIPLDEQITQP